MAFIVKYRGLDVQCESISDINELADQVEVTRTKEDRRAKREATRVPVGRSTAPLFADRSIRGVIQELKSPQRKLISAIAESERTDSELRDLLGLDGNKALAGVLSSISKASKRLGLDHVFIEKQESRAGNGEREYRYSIRPESLEEVQRALLNGHA
jgi:hypothetical protein